MLPTDRTGSSELEAVYIPTVGEDRIITPSMLYNVLPALVSNRIPTIPSLRRSLSGKRHTKSHSLTEIPAPETPPPDYTSRAPSGSATPNNTFGETDYEFSDAASERPASSASTVPPPFASYETKTGIKWKYASQGTNLMTLAYRESSIPIRETDETTASLTRQLYIHSMTYLLRGLPNDLTPEETLSLHASLPQSMARLQADASAHALVPMSQRASLLQERPPQEPTMLHRLTAVLVFQTFILIQFLLPYIKLFLSHTYQFERKHQITKRLVNSGVTTVDELGRRSLKLSQTICQMNDGKVGQAINEMTIWWVRGVTGGVQQGIEEGWSTMRATPAHSTGRVTPEKPS